MPSGCKLDVSVLCHLYHKFIQFLLNAYIPHISREVSFFDYLFNRMTPGSIVRFCPGSTCFKKL